MKKLMVLLILILTFTGCIGGNDEELDLSKHIYPKGTPFKTYTYDEKIEITRKVMTYDEDNKRVYPEVTKEYNKLQSLLIQEAQRGNKLADKEANEWAEIDLFRKYEK